MMKEGLSLKKFSKPIKEKATITGKNQITIPKEICNLFNLKPGNLVLFEKKGDSIIFEPENFSITCFACKGDGYIEDKTCFVCKGNERINNDVNDNPMVLTGLIASNGYLYGVSTRVKNGKNNKKCPEIEIDSENYSKEIMKKIQNKIQKKIQFWYENEINLLNTNIKKRPVGRSFQNNNDNNNKISQELLKVRV